MQKKMKDWIIISPADIDVNKSPLRDGIKEETYIMGAFNPGMTRLPNGNLLLMVRIAESLKCNEEGEDYLFIRWDNAQGFIINKIPIDKLDRSDPRKYLCTSNKHSKEYVLTSFSWLLPIEISSDGKEVLQYHYNKAIIPTQDYQEYGIEDARISRIYNKYYMTTCSVESGRHSTTLYSSRNGLDYDLEGMILDHQNKDMVIFPEKISDYYYALTRPIGEHYFYNHGNFQGPSVKLAQSPDLMHWKPAEEKYMHLISTEYNFVKFGAGSPPIKTDKGWMILFHGVIENNGVGKYNTYKAFFSINNIYDMKEMDLDNPVLSSIPKLTKHLKELKFVDDIVFTTGIERIKDEFIIASGENDLCCRISVIPEKLMIAD